MIIWHHHVEVGLVERQRERKRESFKVRRQNRWTERYTETLFNLSYSSLLNQVKFCEQEDRESYEEENK